MVDDCSTDGTFEEVGRLFPEIQVIQNESNKGAAVSRNVGMQNTNQRSEFILSHEEMNKRFLKHIYLTSRNKIIFMRKHSYCFIFFICLYSVYLLFYIFKAIKYRQFSALKDL